MKRCDLRLVRIGTQTVVSVSSPNASSIACALYLEEGIVLSCNAHNVLSRVCCVVEFVESVPVHIP